LSWLGTSRPSSPSLPAAAPSPAQADDLQPLRLALESTRVRFLGRLSYVMLSRVVLVTLLLLASVAVQLWAGRVEVLGGPLFTTLFMIVGTICALNLVYAAILDRARDPASFGLAQIAGDLGFTTILVHITGGGQSAFVVLYPLATLAAAMLFVRRGALLTAVAASALFAAVALGGYNHLLPPVPGQLDLPWSIAGTELVWSVVRNTAICLTVAVLGSFLAGELQRTGHELDAQHKRVADLSVLNADIVRCLTSGLITVDRNGKVLIANRAAGDILGIPPERMRMRPLSDVAPVLADQIVVEPGFERREVSYRRPGRGDLRLGLTVSPLTDHRNERVGQILSFQDLTELRRFEEAARRAEHLAGLGRVAAGIAHELRNPLASMSGSLELLRGAHVLTEEDRTLMNIVLKEIDRLSGLVGGLLDYARPVPPTKAPMDLRELLSDVVRVFDAEAARGRVRCTLVPAPPVPAEADPSQLRQVAWNILRNAADATPEGGEIRIELLSEPRRVGFRVTDSGPGIPPDVMPHVFEPFFTTKKDGTGLGLAAVHRILEEHGGSVELKSPPGRGAAVTVWLPA
jgi:two-component system, NtrC family, sensor histidine kinase PilS